MVKSLAHGRARAAPGNDRHRPDERVLPILYGIVMSSETAWAWFRLPSGSSASRRCWPRRGRKCRLRCSSPSCASSCRSRREWRESVMPIGRGTVLGFLIGIIPGSAHIISSFVSYAEWSCRLSRHRGVQGRRGGRGGGSRVGEQRRDLRRLRLPMLALGVPLRPHPAVMLAALMVHGVSPGPLLITGQPALFWGFIASMYVGNLILLALNLPMVGLFVNVLRVPYSSSARRSSCSAWCGVYAVRRQRGRRVWIRHRHGRPGLWPESSASRPPPSCSAPSSLHMLQSWPETIAGDVRRTASTRSSISRPISGTLARVRGGPRAPQPRLVDGALPRLATADPHDEERNLRRRDCCVRGPRSP